MAAKEPDFFSPQVIGARRFYLQKSRLPDGRPRVVCGGCEHTAPDFEINRTDFPYWCIELVAKGSGRAVLNGYSWELKAGTLFTYGPGISQHIASAGGGPMVKYFIDFTGQRAVRLLTKHIGPLGTAVHLRRADAVTAVCDTLIAQGLSDSPYKAMTCSLLLEYLLYRIADIRIGQAESPSRAFATYQSCRQTISRNFMTLQSLAQIADACMIDAAYLCRLFKRFDTQSPYQYLLNLKMAYAADCFQKTGVLVKEMAGRLGFDDAFHFSRTFKRIFGISPRAFKGLR